MNSIPSEGTPQTRRTAEFQEQSIKEWIGCASVEAELEFARAQELQYVTSEYWPQTETDQKAFCNELFDQGETLVKFKPSKKDIRISSHDLPDILLMDIDVFEFYYSKLKDKDTVEADDQIVETTGVAWKDNDTVSVLLTQTTTAQDGTTREYTAAWVEVCIQDGEENIYVESCASSGDDIDCDAITDGRSGPYIQLSSSDHGLRIINRDTAFNFVEAFLPNRKFTQLEGNEALILMAYFGDAAREWENLVLDRQRVDEEREQYDQLDSPSPKNPPSYN